MSRNTCPRCGHEGLRTTSEQRAMQNGETHTTQVWKCGECGWRNV